ncbi:MAG: YitT family protein, partial [Eubacteriales bacterium]
MKAHFKGYETIKEYAILTAATLIMAVGIYVFRFPNHFSFGGVTGIAVVLASVLPISASGLTFLMNLLLLLLGLLVLGRKFGIKTIYVTLLLSVLLSLAEHLFPMSAPLTDEPMLELIFAVVIPAIASAILFNRNAS